MSKDTYWFSHDSNAKDDPKIMLLIDQLGLEGYGIYWVLIETLRDQPEYKYPLKLLPVLAKRYFTSGEKFAAVVSGYNLFSIQNDEFFFSDSLISRMKPLENNREKRRIAGIKSGEARRQKRLTDGEQTANTCSTHVEQMPNKIELSKVKESKVKESKEGEEKTPTQISVSESENGAYMSFASIQERMLSDQWIDEVVASKKWMKAKFKHHIFEWLGVKQLAGTYRDFTLGKLKEFCIRDYKPEPTEEKKIYYKSNSNYC